MIHENARRIRRDFFGHVLHGFALFLSAGVIADTEARKNIKTGIVADIGLHRAEHR